MLWGRCQLLDKVWLAVARVQGGSLRPYGRRTMQEVQCSWVAGTAAVQCMTSGMAPVGCSSTQAHMGICIWQCQVRQASSRRSDPLAGHMGLFQFLPETSCAAGFSCTACFW